jgi:hypothetical protein
MNIPQSSPSRPTIPFALIAVAVVATGAVFSYRQWCLHADESSVREAIARSADLRGTAKHMLESAKLDADQAEYELSRLKTETANRRETARRDVDRLKSEATEAEGQAQERAAAVESHRKAKAAAEAEVAAAEKTVAEARARVASLAEQRAKLEETVKSGADAYAAELAARRAAAARAVEQSVPELDGLEQKAAELKAKIVQVRDEVDRLKGSKDGEDDRRRAVAALAPWMDQLTIGTTLRGEASLWTQHRDRKNTARLGLVLTVKEADRETGKLSIEYSLTGEYLDPANKRRSLNGRALGEGQIRSDGSIQFTQIRSLSTGNDEVRPVTFDGRAKIDGGRVRVSGSMIFQSPVKNVGYDGFEVSKS